MYVHNTEHYSKTPQQSRFTEEPCTPLNATRVCESASSLVNATSTSLHCKSLANEGDRKSSRPTDFGEYLADAWEKSCQYNGIAILWVPRSLIVALWVTTVHWLLL